jgi:hypothetical protein
MDQAQDTRKKTDIIEEEITTKHLVTQKVLVELIEISHLLTQQGIFMHIESQGEVHKCFMLGIKEEDMILTVYKESRGRLSHHPLMVKEKGNMMLKPGFLESRSIFSCTNTHIT